MTRAVPLAALVLVACGPAASDTTPGAQIEAAAVRAGLIADPARAAIEGMWARGSDRLCIVPETADMRRIGIVLDYGPGQRCTASGTVRHRRDRLDVQLGACRLEAAIDGERIVFPSIVPAACDTLCTGRASLAALTVDRLSTSVSEATALRTPRGRPVCGD